LKVLDKVTRLSEILTKHSFEDAHKEAEIIITTATSIKSPDLYVNEFELTEQDIALIDDMICQRLKGRPLQYITSEVDFFDLHLKVGDGVFIPRPETEYMVDQVIKIMTQKGFNRLSRLKILDLCTGSGCIALTLARYFVNASVIATDISLVALKYAKINRDIHRVSNVSFIAGDLFSPLKDYHFHLIISNPPYIATSEIDNLQIEIKDYEPKIALDGGEDGIDFYRKILPKAGHYLKKDGLLILEIGLGQSDELKRLALSYGYGKVSFIKDYSGIDRIFIAGGD